MTSPPKRLLSYTSPQRRGAEGQNRPKEPEAGRLYLANTTARRAAAPCAAALAAGPTGRRARCTLQQRALPPWVCVLGFPPRSRPSPPPPREGSLFAADILNLAAYNACYAKHNDLEPIRGISLRITCVIRNIAAINRNLCGGPGTPPKMRKNPLGKKIIKTRRPGPCSGRPVLLGGSPVSDRASPAAPRCVFHAQRGPPRLGLPPG